MTRSALRPALLALGAALALGLAGRVAVHAGSGLPHGDALSAAGRAAVGLGAPWLAVAWAVGALARRPVAGAVTGAAALALATVGWYSLSVAAGPPQTVVYAAEVAPPWAVVALVAGGACGFAGAAWRWSVALPAGALIGEAMLLVGDWTSRAAEAVLLLELSLGLGLAGYSARRRPAVVPLVVACAVAMAFGEHAVRDALRLRGWTGP